MRWRLLQSRRGSLLLAAFLSYNWLFSYYFFLFRFGFGVLSFYFKGGLKEFYISCRRGSHSLDFFLFLVSVFDGKLRFDSMSEWSDLRGVSAAIKLYETDMRLCTLLVENKKKYLNVEV